VRYNVKVVVPNPPSPSQGWQKTDRRETKMTKLAIVEGIGEVYAGKLMEAGIATAEALLEKGSTPQGRKGLAEETDISGKLILEWVNHVDLFRIKGVGEEYSDLLEEAGVDTVPELAQRNAANLHAKLAEVNEAKKLVRRLPAQSQVADWIEQAKALPRVITY
jgi:predicted flap endonuclease-1-like 5' DNA nuclease